MGKCAALCVAVLVGWRWNWIWHTFDISTEVITSPSPGITRPYHPQHHQTSADPSMNHHSKTWIKECSSSFISLRFSGATIVVREGIHWLDKCVFMCWVVAVVAVGPPNVLLFKVALYSYSASSKFSERICMKTIFALVLARAQPHLSPSCLAPSQHLFTFNISIWIKHVTCHGSNRNFS